ncbi:MAG: hypothetical protein ABWZ02_10770 [Nakamurella sp.]
MQSRISGKAATHQQGPSGRIPVTGAERQPRWATAALVVAGLWSAIQLALGFSWLLAHTLLSGVALGNPFDPAVDANGADISLLTAAGGSTSAAVLTVLGGLGVMLVAVMAWARPARNARRPWWCVVVVTLAGLLAATLALVLPDYRLIATVGYTPAVIIEQLFSADPGISFGQLYTQTTNAMIIMTLAGIAFAAAAVAFSRRMRQACPHCGRSSCDTGWMSKSAATRWGKWATTVAIVIPVGYAITRVAWALGIPLGVSQELLDEIDSFVWLGAVLGAMAIGGAILTLGLVQRWGEVFPRWIPGLRGRRVPISLAVVPALLVSVIVTSAGLMFCRMGLTGKFENNFPGSGSDIAAWLPELFWPLWGVALAAAAIAYWLRRRGGCRYCGRGMDPV